jgi:predicted nucleic acid-binding protein
MLLLDTDILIDCLRGVPAARTWLESAAKEAFGIPGIVAMELLIGARRHRRICNTGASPWRPDRR